MRLIQIGLLALAVTLISACQKAPETQEQSAAATSTPTVEVAPTAETPAVATEPAVSPLTEAAPPSIPAVDKAVQPEAAALGCAAGCTTMPCPPPNGQTACCKRVATGYQKC